jgi:hypothetical protein
MEQSRTMIEARGNIFDASEADAICITTNGFVKRSGEAVMGRGCALEACRRFPGIDKTLGKLINEKGNQCHEIGLFPLCGAKTPNKWLVSFPVKPVSKRFEKPEDVVSHLRHKFNPGSTIPGWACVADVRIIARSAVQLVTMADQRQWNMIVLPRPGCGAGELNWEQDVKPVLSSILDDRFVCMTL